VRPEKIDEIDTVGQIAVTRAELDRLLECRGVSRGKQVEIARCAMGEVRGHRDTAHEIEVVLQQRGELGEGLPLRARDRIGFGHPAQEGRPPPDIA
jgi:hypothetical protein